MSCFFCFDALQEPSSADTCPPHSELTPQTPYTSPTKAATEGPAAAVAAGGTSGAAAMEPASATASATPGSPRVIKQSGWSWKRPGAIAVGSSSKDTTAPMRTAAGRKKGGGLVDLMGLNCMAKPRTASPTAGEAEAAREAKFAARCGAIGDEQAVREVAAAEAAEGGAAAAGAEGAAAAAAAGGAAAGGGAGAEVAAAAAQVGSGRARGGEGGRGGVDGRGGEGERVRKGMGLIKKLPLVERMGWNCMSMPPTASPRAEDAEAAKVQATARDGDQPPPAAEAAGVIAAAAGAGAAASEGMEFYTRAPAASRAEGLEVATAERALDGLMVDGGPVAVDGWVEGLSVAVDGAMTGLEGGSAGRGAAVTQEDAEASGVVIAASEGLGAASAASSEMDVAASEGERGWVGEGATGGEGVLKGEGAGVVNGSSIEARWLGGVVVNGELSGLGGAEAGGVGAPKREEIAAAADAAAEQGGREDVLQMAGREEEAAAAAVSLASAPAPAPASIAAAAAETEAEGELQLTQGEGIAAGAAAAAAAEAPANKATPAAPSNAGTLADDAKAGTAAAAAALGAGCLALAPDPALAPTSSGDTVNGSTLGASEADAAATLNYHSCIDLASLDKPDQEPKVEGLGDDGNAAVGMAELPDSSPAAAAAVGKSDDGMTTATSHSNSADLSDDSGDYSDEPSAAAVSSCGDDSAAAAGTDDGDDSAAAAAAGTDDGDDSAAAAAATDDGDDSPIAAGAAGGYDDTTASIAGSSNSASIEAAITALPIADYSAARSRESQSEITPAPADSPTHSSTAAALAAAAAAALDEACEGISFQRMPSRASGAGRSAVAISRLAAAASAGDSYLVSPRVSMSPRGYVNPNESVMDWWGGVGDSRSREVIHTNGMSGERSRGVINTDEMTPEEKADAVGPVRDLLPLADEVEAAAAAILSSVYRHRTSQSCKEEGDDLAL